MAQVKALLNTLIIQDHMQECSSFTNLRFMYIKWNPEVENNISYDSSKVVHKSGFPSKIFFEMGNLYFFQSWRIYDYFSAIGPDCSRV